MISVNVIDDFLTKEEHEAIQKQLSGAYQYWIWNSSHMYDDLTETSTNLESKDNQVDYPQFVWSVYKEHTIVDTKVYSLVKPVLSKLNYKELLKIKCNLNIPYRDCDESKYGYKHTDNREGKAFTGIYYVNDCDGDTVLFDEQEHGHRIEPRANRFVYFPSKVSHSGNTPKNSTRRIVINFNWIPYDI